MVMNRDLPLDGVSNFVYEERAGEGSHIYVIEKGIKTDLQNVSMFERFTQSKLTFMCSKITTKSFPGQKSSKLKHRSTLSKTRMSTRLRILMAQQSHPKPWANSTALPKAQPW
jgi:hypothetical protein